MTRDRVTRLDIIKKSLVDADVGSGSGSGSASGSKGNSDEVVAVPEKPEQ